MAYVPDPQDTTNPTDATDAESAQLEFRNLKKYLAGSYQKNLIINGAFNIDQIQEGAVYVVAANTVVQDLDNWSSLNVTSTVGAFSVQRVADALHPGEFRMKIICTTADAAPAAGDRFTIFQKIEGTLCAEAGLDLGVATAQGLHISFEVECTITGTFGVAIVNSAGNRSYIGLFTVLAANTRQNISLLLTADTAGVWLTDTGAGLNLDICLMSGATFQTPANVWTAGNFDTSAAQTNFIATINNTMYLRNFQVVRSAIAIPFLRRQIQDEMLLVQRYYQKSWYVGQAVGSLSVGYVSVPASANIANGNIIMGVKLPVIMRANPTLILYPFQVPANVGQISSASGIDNGIANSCVGAAINPTGFYTINNSGGVIVPAGGGFIFHYTTNARLS